MTARVEVVGAGPGGIAAARRLKDLAGEDINVLLFEREPSVEYLPGTIPVFLGRTSRQYWRQVLSPKGVEVAIGEVKEVSGDQIRLDGNTYEADAVIASPGLTLDQQRVPNVPNVHAFWDLAGAEAAASAASNFRIGVVAVVVSSLPYRCPPAPFGMAMELADYYRGELRDVRVVLTTPEEIPLAAIGGGVPEFLEESCAAAGVELVTGFEPDLAELGEDKLTSNKGVSIHCDIAFVIPPHARSPMLAGFPGRGPLVEVSPRFESAEPGLFVVGDAAMAPLPRAAEAAAAEGRTAADAVLERLGISPEREPHLPEPECYVGHGGGLYSRISLRYPGGLPPRGGPEVTLEEPSKWFAVGFENSFNHWRDLRGGG